MAQLFNLLYTLLNIYTYVLIGYILMSWFPGARESSIGRMLSTLSEPYLEPFRKIIPPIGMIDISPIVAILVLEFARYGLSDLFRLIASM